MKVFKLVKGLMIMTVLVSSLAHAAGTSQGDDDKKTGEKPCKKCIAQALRTQKVADPKAASVEVIKELNTKSKKAD